MRVAASAGTSGAGKRAAGCGSGVGVLVVDYASGPLFGCGGREPGEDTGGVLWLSEFAGRVQIVIGGLAGLCSSQQQARGFRRVAQAGRSQERVA